MKNYIIIGFIISALLIGSFLFIKNNSEEQSSNANENSTSMNDLTREESLDDEFPSEEGPKLIVGSEDAEVIITEFVDYKCPNCNVFHRTTKAEIEAEYGDRVAFEIHHTPFIGPDSGRAARGAYCSETIGGVFELYNDGIFNYMYDNYYAEQNFQAEFEDILSAEVITDIYSNAGGSDTAEFQDCVADKENTNLYINADQLLAAEKEVRGTPSFVVGDTSLVGPQQISVFKALIEAEL